jgi:hypothetical protein
VRDLLGAFLWLGSYLSAEIDWRGEEYRLTTGGKMLRSHASKASANVGMEST